MPMPNPFGAPDPANLGDMLGQQRVDETEEARKKRMQDQQQQRQLGPLNSVSQMFAGGLGKGSLSGFLGGLSGR